MAGQGVRAAGYGFTAVVLGALLADRGFSSLQAGAVLTALIAGTALASGGTLVTHNTREFRRVRGLSVEDWY